MDDISVSTLETTKSELRRRRLRNKYRNDDPWHAPETPRELAEEGVLDLYRGRAPPHGSYHMCTMNALHNPDLQRPKKSRGAAGSRQSRAATAPMGSKRPRMDAAMSGANHEGKAGTLPASVQLTVRLNSLATRISRISNRFTKQDEIRANLKIAQAGIKLLPELARLAMLREGKSSPSPAPFNDTMSLGSRGSARSMNSLESRQSSVHQDDFLGILDRHYDLEPAQLRGFVKRYIGASLNSEETAGFHARLLRIRDSPGSPQSVIGSPPGLAVTTEEVLTFCCEVTTLEQQAQRRSKQNLAMKQNPRLPTPVEKVPVPEPERTYGQACSEWLSSPHADLLRREKLRRSLRGSTDRDIVDDLSMIRGGSFDHASAIHKITAKIHDEQKLFASAELGKFLAGNRKNDIKELKHDEIKELTKMALMGEKKHMAEARRLQSLGLLKEASEENKKAEASKFLGILATGHMSGVTKLDEALKVEDSKILIRSMVENSRVERMHKVRDKLKVANQHRLALALVPNYREQRDRERFRDLMLSWAASEERVQAAKAQRQQLESERQALLQPSSFQVKDEETNNLGEFSSLFVAWLNERATNAFVALQLEKQIGDLDMLTEKLAADGVEGTRELRTAGANILQSVAKRFIVRRRIQHQENALSDDRKALAIIVIQGIWRIALSKMRVKQAHGKRDQELLRAATVKIQLAFRSRAARKHAERLRNEYASEAKQVAAIRIQCMVRRRDARRKIQRVQEKREHELVLWAALRLQCKFRYLSARRNVKALKEYRRHLLLHGTTIRIQSQFRARRSRLKVDAIRARRFKAAVTIQAFVRGRLHHHGHVAVRKDEVQAKAHNVRQLILMLKCQHYFRRFLRFNPRPVNVMVVNGSNIGKQLRGGDCFPFVYMTLSSLETGKREQVCLRKSSVLPSQHDPEWNETFLVPAMNRDMTITFTVCSAHPGGKPTFLGEASMRLGARYRTWNEEIKLALKPLQEVAVYNGKKEIKLEQTKEPQRTPAHIAIVLTPHPMGSSQCGWVEIMKKGALGKKWVKHFGVLANGELTFLQDLKTNRAADLPPFAVNHVEMEITDDHELIISNEGMNNIHMRTPIRWRTKIWREKINNAKAYLLPPEEREAFLLENRTEAQRKELEEELDEDFHADFESMVSEHASISGSEGQRISGDLDIDMDSNSNDAAVVLQEDEV